MTSTLLDAAFFAAKAHKTQSRKGNGGEPYINHLLEVVTLLSSTAKVTDVDILIAAVLHDTLEDTKVTANDISERYGQQVLQYVEAVTDDKTLSLEERRDKQVNTINTYSDPIKYIKLADHCSNIASLPPSWTPERLTSYLVWSRQVAEQCFSVSEALAHTYKERYDIALRSINTKIRR